MAKVEYSKKELVEAGMLDKAEPVQKQLTNYEYIEQELRRKEIVSRVVLALGKNAKDEDAKNEAFRYIASVLMEIKKTENDEKKDLTICTIDSIINAMIDAANFRLPIDGRQLAYLVRYKNGAEHRASFQPGYKGFLYKIAEHYSDVDFTAEPVFSDDELTLSDNGGFQTYTHIRKNPFQREQKNMMGLITCLTYSDGAGRHSKIATLPKSEIDQIRKAAKQDYIWAAWFFEKAKAAGLKRLCKIHFATVMGVQELAQYDNEHHFEPVSEVTPVNAAKELATLLEHKQETVMPMVVEAKEEVPVELTTNKGDDNA